MLRAAGSRLFGRFTTEAIPTIMQDTVQALLGLQQIDRHIFGVEGELRRLPQELARRGEQIAAAERSIAERLHAANELRVRIKEIEDATVGQRQRQRKLENECNSTKIDAAMLASYQHEIRQVKRTISQAEDDALKMIEEAEVITKDADTQKAALDAERPAFEEFQANVAKEMAAAEARLAELQAERAKLSAESISPDHLDLYTRLLATREGEAMAELQDLCCQGCYTGIPKNLAVRLARGVELVQCINCSRILYSRM